MCHNGWYGQGGLCTKRPFNFKLASHFNPEYILQNYSEFLNLSSSLNDCHEFRAQKWNLSNNTCIMKGNDVFCVLPTGYGKSVVYGILQLAYDILLGK